MAVANAKRERSAALVGLETKIINLESLTAAAKASDLDNAWCSVKDELKLIEDKHKEYKLAIMSENDDEMPEEGPTSSRVLNQWYSDQIDKVRDAEKAYRQKRHSQGHPIYREAFGHGSACK